ncbi:glycosyltransferase [Gulosibacter sp. 10]|uniref:glycosyltransferase n=1 Tax=Gulosibacter sp. 10 TaxID=1255570 RepID=UPI000B35FDCF|nr:glycosyltransferase [Gulosibacter sp. 10]
MTALPRILVLLATHNGEQFLAEQLDSVLNQRGVEVSVVVSDDASTDGTLAALDRYRGDGRVRVLEPGEFGSSAANFFRLVREVPAEEYDAIGFCDQDDIWMPWKLQRHYELLSLSNGLDGRGPYAGVSSNVTAVQPDGTRQIVVKNQLQRQCDYAFESGGPGSTFLLRPEAYEFVREQLLVQNGPASLANSHDWLFYALVRAHGWRWFIDGESSVDYRQHGRNELGANEGLQQNWRRLRGIVAGTHHQDALRIILACRPVAAGRTSAQLEWLYERVAACNFTSRLRLVRHMHRFRRRRRDQLALAATLVTGLW